MDYEFRRDITGQVYAQFSMQHEVIGYWLNEEIKGDLAKIALIQDQAKTLKNNHDGWQLEGHEYTLWMDSEEVMVRANQIDFSGDEMEEGMNYYDEESLAFCGVTDFLTMLDSYIRFSNEK